MTLVVYNLGTYNHLWKKLLKKSREGLRWVLIVYILPKCINTLVNLKNLKEPKFVQKFKIIVHLLKKGDSFALISSQNTVERLLIFVTPLQKDSKTEEVDFLVYILCSRFFMNFSWE